ncbi:MAG TPA: galactosyltransferase-related protein [Cellvibrio sp.]|nr:galactosyltransferase-related protein [Cellvibrio sp.]
MRNFLDVIIAATKKPEVERVVTHFHSISSQIGSIIIIDFDEKKPSMPHEKIHKLKEKIKGFRYIFVEGQQYFNKSIALNIGASYSSSEIILFCDADILLEPDFLKNGIGILSQDDKNFITPEFVTESDTRESRLAPGICMLYKSDYVLINGYSNEYKGWGMEDMDFIERLKKTGIKRVLYSSGIHMSHPDEARTQNYHSNSVDEMRRQNRALFQKKIEEKNLNGTMDIDIINTNHKEYIN